MSATTQLAVPTRIASPVAFWHLLSLDAPTVAALWMWFIARSCQIRLPAAAPAAMFLAVWILYAVDRLLDAAHSANDHELEARHHFHHRHRRAFLLGIAAAAVGLAALLPDLNATAISLYLIEGVSLVAWFVVVHTAHRTHRLPKEIAVGVFFSAAVFIPTIARQPSLVPELLPCACLFAMLCGLNCLFIYAWEQRPVTRQPHATTRLALNHLCAFAVSLIALAGVLSFVAPNALPAATAVATALLLLLHRHRQRLSRIHLRAAADLALLTPVLFLPFLR